MFSFFRITLISLFGLVLVSSQAFSQTGDVAERFSGFNASSKAKINHEPLTEFLAETVWEVGRSNSFLGSEKPDAYRNSRIKTAKPLAPSRFEGSRLFVHAFTEGHKTFLLSYQEGLELLSNRRAIAKFNKNEQLAYWLNLYNIIVINKIIEEYPIQNLKPLRSPKRGKNSFWNEKVTTVEGIPLSLTDIEKILFSNYDSPLVAFGLWQGSIGGPRLLSKAYSGSNVWNLLEKNAEEFVNSNRGLRPPTGSRLKVSNFYEWMMPAFGTSDEHVMMFIKEFYDPNFVTGVEGVSSLSFKIYNWQIADVMGGTLHTGSKSKLGGVLTGKTMVVGGAGEGGGDIGGSLAFYELSRSMEAHGPYATLPDDFIKLITGVAKNTKMPVPNITTEECGPDEDCSLGNAGGDKD